MKRSLLGLILAVISLFPVAAFSQAEYVTKGSSGWGISVAGSSAHDMIGLGTSLGFVKSGMFDFGLAGGLVFGGGATATSIGLYTDLYPLKQDSVIGLSIGLGGSVEYDRISYSGTYHRLSTHTELYSVGTAINRNQPLSSRLSIQPELGISYTGSLAGWSGGSTSRHIELAFITKDREGVRFLITPTVVFSDGITSYGLTIGWIGERRRSPGSDRW